MSIELIDIFHKIKEALFNRIEQAYRCCDTNLVINPIQDMGAKSPTTTPLPSPTSFSSVTSTDRVPNLQNFLAFSFNPFATMAKNCRVISSASPKLLNLNEDHPPKKWFFRSNPYKIEIMTTSLIEKLELLASFAHMTTPTI